MGDDEGKRTTNEPSLNSEKRQGQDTCLRPSLRVLQEGGDEAGGVMHHYLQPGPFAPTIEETIIQQADEMVKELRRR